MSFDSELTQKEWKPRLMSAIYGILGMFGTNKDYIQY